VQADATLLPDEAQRAEALALTPDQEAAMPGRPERPHLVSATQVPARSPFTPEGRAALLHAICHIEFNAINLALDAVWRFADMPAAFYRDWLQVAGEEALHFTLLRTHLESLGSRYGDFDAHDGLWTMCHKTRHDIVARMALVPRTLEARGLDATPPLQDKLRKAGWTVTVSELGYEAKEHMDLPPDERTKVEDFLHAIDDHDDVHRIYTALK